jgi:hypothetical protein
MGLAVSLLATPRYTLPQIEAAKQSLRAWPYAKTTRDEPSWFAPVAGLLAFAFPYLERVGPAPNGGL